MDGSETMLPARVTSCAHARSAVSTPAQQTRLPTVKRRRLQPIQQPARGRTHSHCFAVILAFVENTNETLQQLQQQLLRTRSSASGGRGGRPEQTAYSL